MHNAATVLVCAVEQEHAIEQDDAIEQDRTTEQDSAIEQDRANLQVCANSQVHARSKGCTNLWNRLDREPLFHDGSEVVSKLLRLVFVRGFDHHSHDRLGT